MDPPISLPESPAQRTWAVTTRAKPAGAGITCSGEPLQVLTTAGAVVGRRRGLTAGERPAPDVLQLRPRRHLLREQRGLDAVEDALEPAHELGLHDAQLG